MIRQIEAADVGAAVELLAEFRAEAAPHVTFDAPACARTVRTLASSRLGFARLLDLDGPAGLMLGAVQPLTWAEGLAAREIVWFVRPACRGRWGLRLLDAFEAWARGVGARHVALTDAGHDLSALCRRRGYVPAERVWMREVT